MFDLETTTQITKNLINTGFLVLLGFAARVVAGVGINLLVKKLEDDDPDTISELEQRTQTLAGLGKNIANVFIFGVVIVMVLSEWGINIAPILTGAGIIGLAVGFGTQTLVKDIVTGFFVLLENHYNVGDKVNVAGKEGTVVEIKLRTTVLRGSDGKTYIIPNSAISTIEKD